MPPSPAPTQIAMTVCFMLGTLEPQAVLSRQLGTVQALLYDLMPAHVAHALLRSELGRRRAQCRAAASEAVPDVSKHHVSGAPLRNSLDVVAAAVAAAAVAQAAAGVHMELHGSSRSSTSGSSDLDVYVGDVGEALGEQLKRGAGGAAGVGHQGAAASGLRSADGGAPRGRGQQTQGSDDDRPRMCALPPLAVDGREGLSRGAGGAGIGDSDATRQADAAEREQRVLDWGESPLASPGVLLPGAGRPQPQPQQQEQQRASPSAAGWEDGFGGPQAAGATTAPRIGGAEAVVAGSNGQHLSQEAASRGSSFVPGGGTAARRDGGSSQDNGEGNGISNGAVRGGAGTCGGTQTVTDDAADYQQRLGQQQQQQHPLPTTLVGAGPTFLGAAAAQLDAVPVNPRPTSSATSSRVPSRARSQPASRHSSTARLLTAARATVAACASSGTSTFVQLPASGSPRNGEQYHATSDEPGGPIQSAGTSGGTVQRRSGYQSPVLSATSRREALSLAQRTAVTPPGGNGGWGGIASSLGATARSLMQGVGLGEPAGVATGARNSRHKGIGMAEDEHEEDEEHDGTEGSLAGEGEEGAGGEGQVDSEDDLEEFLLRRRAAGGGRSFTSGGAGELSGRLARGTAAQLLSASRSERGRASPSTGELGVRW